MPDCIAGTCFRKSRTEVWVLQNLVLPQIVACSRMRCDECITEMHKLNYIIKAGAAEVEVRALCEWVSVESTFSVTRSISKPTTVPAWRRTMYSSARITWPTTTLPCSRWSSTTSSWTGLSTSAWPWGSANLTRRSSSTRSPGREFQGRPSMTSSSSSFLLTPPLLTLHIPDHLWTAHTHWK